jgi:CelD/BcsL family acetyltransferase involved in cellulose biosynthesis
MEPLLGSGGAVPRPPPPTEPLRLVVYDDPAAASDAWAWLEALGGTAYQTQRFLLPWITHQAAAARITPRIAIAFDPQERPRLLLPFGTIRRGFLHAVVYLGGRDSNAGLPLAAPDLHLTEDAARGLLRDYAARISPTPDLFQLANQPRAWKAQPNAFALPASHRSPSAAYAATFRGDAEAFLKARDSKAARKKLRSKANHLAEIGTVSVSRAASIVEVRDIVDTFIAQKQARFAARGIDARMTGDHTRAFLEALGSSGALDLYTLRCGGRIAAIYGGLPHRGHWYGLINSFDQAREIARCSPADLLLREIVVDLARRGMKSFDLGIGEARYKSALCDETVDLVDAFVPVSAQGHALALFETARLAAKREIKQRPWAYSLATKLRERTARD